MRRLGASVFAFACLASDASDARAQSDAPVLPRALAGRSLMASDASPTRSAVTWNTGKAERVPMRGYQVVVSFPERVRLVDGAFDVIVHFHGGPELQERNMDRTSLGAVVVGVNAGVVSGHYEKAYAEAGALSRLEGEAIEAARATGRFGEAPRSHRLAISTWSAGFGALQAIANDASDIALARVDAILVADGVFTHWTKPKDGGLSTPDLSSLSFLTSFAERARRGEKLLAITHTEIPTQGYPSMPEVMSAFTDALGLAHQPMMNDNGGDPLFPAHYRSHEGGLWITGYAGGTYDAHINQISRMSETMLPWLAQRWCGEISCSRD